MRSSPPAHEKASAAPVAENKSEARTDPSFYKQLNPMEQRNGANSATASGFIRTNQEEVS